jgi:Ca2+-binding RTX toxin-like protein
MDHMTQGADRERRRRDRARDARRAGRRRQTLRLEGLEDRRLLSTIEWLNRGQPGLDLDDFVAVYGSVAAAEHARQLVDQAILAWQNVITNFNFQLASGDTNKFRLEISAFSFFDNGPGSTKAQTNIIEKDDAGKPRGARIFMDNNAGGTGWYFDTVFDANGNYRFDHAEFNDLDNPFSATRPGSHPADYFTTILHEIGHAVGIAGDDALRINNFLTTDPNNSERKFFNSGPTSATFIEDETGFHFSQGTHPSDLLNATFPDEDRRLISDLTARVLRDAYDYTVTLPSTLHLAPAQQTPLPTFLVNLNRSTGELVVNGDKLVKGDRITYSAGGNGPVVTVNDVTVSLGFTPLTSIRVGPEGLGEFPTGLPSDHDEIQLNGLPPFIPVNVDAGTGNDSIRINDLTGWIDGLDVTVQGGLDIGPGGAPVDSDTLIIRDLEGSAKTYGIAKDFVLKADDLFLGAFISYSGLESVFLFGRSGGGDYIVSSTDEDTPVTITGSPAKDTFQISPSSGNLDEIEAQVTISGALGGDSLELNDSNNPADSTYTIDDTLLTRGPVRVQQSGIASVSIRGGSGKNTFNVEKTFAGTPVTINGGIGDDTFNVVHKSEDLADIGGLLTVVGGAGSDRLSVEDQVGLAASADYSLTGSLLSRNGKIHVSHPGIDELVLLGNNKGNTFEVETVDAATTVMLIAGNGDDTFLLTPGSQDLDDIGREVRLIGGNGHDAVVADDRDSDASATFRFTGTGLTRNGKTVAQFSAGIDEVTVRGGDEADTFDVVKTGEDVEVNLVGGDGNDTFNVEQSAADVAETAAKTEVELFGGFGDDTFNLSPKAQNLGSLNGSVDVDGGGGTDSLVVDDRKSTAAVSYSLATLTLIRASAGKSVIHEFSATENLSIRGSDHDDFLGFSLTEIPALDAVAYEPGTGKDTLAGMARANLFELTGINAGTMSDAGGAGPVVTFVGAENLTGGAQDDTFRLDPPEGISGRFDGGGGSDTLDYTAFTTKVIVHMLVGQATGTFGIAAIENAIGGAGDDNFVGDGADNILIGNDGADFLSSRDGDDILVGGEGDDQLDDISPPPAGGPVERNILIGGRGADRLRGFGGKEELMIGGATVHDASFAALRAIRDEWTSEQPMRTRVAHLRGTTGGGLNGAFLLKLAAPNATVFDDAIADIILAGGNNKPDWFFAADDDATDMGPDDFLN